MSVRIKCVNRLLDNFSLVQTIDPKTVGFLMKCIVYYDDW